MFYFKQKVLIKENLNLELIGLFVSRLENKRQIKISNIIKHEKNKNDEDCE